MFHHLDITSCHARALPRAYGMLIHCHGFVKKIINFFLKKLYGETLLQSTILSRKIKLQAKFLTSLTLKK
jgi:hypothetical protein